MPENDAPNMDLIRMVQQARMAHDADSTPSEIGGVYWIECKPTQQTQSPTPRAGYWLIRTDTAQVDDIWARVKAATTDGRLGYKSKVATAAHGGDPQQRAIHVCTYDAEDVADVARVRAALHEIGTADMVYQRS